MTEINLSNSIKKKAYVYDSSNIIVQIESKILWINIGLFSPEEHIFF